MIYRVGFAMCTLFPLIVTTLNAQDDLRAKVIQNAVDILDDPDVGAELGLTQDQFKDLTEFLYEKHRELLRLGIQVRRAKGNPPQEALVKEKQRVAVGEAMSKLDEVLHDTQIQRLMQLSRQKENSVHLVSGGLLAIDVSKHFELTEVEKEALGKIALESESKLKAIHQKYVRELKDFAKERDEKIVKVLAKEKGMKFRKYFGEPYHLYVERFITLRSWRAHELSRAMQQRKKNDLPNDFRQRK